MYICVYIYIIYIYIYIYIYIHTIWMVTTKARASSEVGIELTLATCQSFTSKSNRGALISTYTFFGVGSLLL